MGSLELLNQFKYDLWLLQKDKSRLGELLALAHIICNMLIRYSLKTVWNLKEEAGSLIFLLLAKLYFLIYLF